MYASPTELDERMQLLTPFQGAPETQHQISRRKLKLPPYGMVKDNTLKMLIMLLSRSKTQMFERSWNSSRAGRFQRTISGPRSWQLEKHSSHWWTASCIIWITVVRIASESLCPNTSERRYSRRATVESIVVTLLLTSCTTTW